MRDPRLSAAAAGACLVFALGAARPAAAEAPLPLAAAVRRAVERDPALKAAGVRIREVALAGVVAEGAFDLRLEVGLDLSSQEQTFDDPALGLETSERRQAALSAALVQPFVWGTRLSLGWANNLVDTNNPFLNCIPGLQSDTCVESRIELRLDQPLLRGFGRRVNVAAITEARAATTVAERRRAATVAQRAEATVAAYVELAVARADLDIRRRALDLAERQLDATRARVAAGRMAPADLPAVEQAVAERRQAVFAAEQAVADRAAALATALGDDEAPAVELPPPETWAGGREDAETRATALHPDLAVLDAEVERLRLVLIPLEDAVLPRLDLSATAARAGTDETFGGAVEAIPEGQTTYYGLALRFAFPVANTGPDADLRRGRLALERARLEREARAIEVRRDAGAAWRALRTAERNEALAREVADLAARTVEAEQAKFELGHTTNLEVLRVQQAHAEALLAVERARADRVLALARLRRLTGTLLESFGLAVE